MPGLPYDIYIFLPLLSFFNPKPQGLKLHLPLFCLAIGCWHLYLTTSFTLKSKVTYHYLVYMRILSSLKATRPVFSITILSNRPSVNRVSQQEARLQKSGLWAKGKHVTGTTELKTHYNVTLSPWKERNVGLIVMYFYMLAKEKKDTQFPQIFAASVIWLRRYLRKHVGCWR